MHLDPVSFRAVTISADQLISRPHQVTRTFTSAAIIAGLTAFLDGRACARRRAGRRVMSGADGQHHAAVHGLSCME